MERLTAEEFANLLRVTLNAVQRKGYVSGAYCHDADMRNFGGETRDDKGPAEIADGEADAMVVSLWRAFYDRESTEEAMPLPEHGGPVDI